MTGRFGAGEGWRLAALLFALAAPSLVAQSAAAAPDLREAARAFGAATGRTDLAAPHPAAVPAILATKSSSAAVRRGAGQFRLVYAPPKKERNRKWAQLLKGSKVLDDNIEALNRQFALPFDIEVRAEDCGEANAWYLYHTHVLHFCYELLGDSTRLLSRRVEPRSQAESVALADSVWTLYHEVAHALIDAYKLPVVGRNEDASDQFATLVMLSSGDQARIVPLVEAILFQLNAKRSRPDFSDSHSADRQRADDILCLVYGSNPKAYGYLVDPHLLPAARANPPELGEGCAADYRNLDSAWDRLLAPYLQKS